MSNTMFNMVVATIYKTLYAEIDYIYNEHGEQPLNCNIDDFKLFELSTGQI